MDRADDTMGGQAIEQASDAIDLVGDPTRLRILRTLATQTGPEGRAQELTFTELRRAVGIEDTGRFNYHLGKLTDEFVTADGDTYQVTSAGLKIVSLVASGVFHEDAETLSETTDYSCFEPSCDNVLEATFDGQQFSLSCPAADHGGLTYPLPPSAVAGRSPDDMVAVAVRQMGADMERLRNETCPFCQSVMERRVPVEDDDLGPDIDGVIVRVVCSRCWMEGILPVAWLLIRHPALISLYHDHDMDIREIPPLSLSFVRNPEQSSLRSTDPVRIDITVELEDEETVLTVDETLSLVEMR